MTNKVSSGFFFFFYLKLIYDGWCVKTDAAHAAQLIMLFFFIMMEMVLAGVSCWVDCMSIFPADRTFKKELKTSMGCLCHILQTSQCTSQMFQGIFFIALVWLTYSPNIFTPVKPRQHSHLHLRNLFCLCGHPANLPLDWHQQKRTQSVFKFDLILHRLWLSYIYACHHSCSLTSILLKC